MPVSPLNTSSSSRGSVSPPATASAPAKAPELGPSTGTPATHVEDLPRSHARDHLGSESVDGRYH